MSNIFRMRLARLVPAAVLAVAAITAVVPAITSAAGETVAVGIHDGGDPASWGYGPATTTISVGQSVTFTNSGTSPHDATAADGSWKTPLLQSGASASVTFATPGSFDFTCVLHPWMKGTIVVTPASSAPAPAPAPIEIGSASGSSAPAPADVAPAVSPAPETNVAPATTTDDAVNGTDAGSGN
jgi:plastocyanin